MSRHGDIGVLWSAEAGRRAFWWGKPIWLNPHIGQDARDWTAAWRQAEALFLQLAGLSTRSERYDARQLAGHRPADIPPAPVRRTMLTRTGRGHAAAARGRSPFRHKDHFFDGNTTVLPRTRKVTR